MFNVFFISKYFILYVLFSGSSGNFCWNFEKLKVVFFPAEVRSTSKRKSWNKRGNKRTTRWRWWPRFDARWTESASGNANSRATLYFLRRTVYPAKFWVTYAQTPLLRSIIKVKQQECSFSIKKNFFIFFFWKFFFLFHFFFWKFFFIFFIFFFLKNFCFFIFLCEFHRYFFPPVTRSGDYYMFEGSDSDEDDIDILAPSRPSEEEVETMGHATGPDPLQVKNLTKKDALYRGSLISTWFPYGFAYVFVLDVELRGDEWQYQGHGAGYPGGEWAQWVGDGQRVCQSRPVPTLHAPSGSTRKCRERGKCCFFHSLCHAIVTALKRAGIFRSMSKKTGGGRGGERKWTWRFSAGAKGRRKSSINEVRYEKL